MNQSKQIFILVADDEKNTLDTLGFILESAHYKVDLVENGKEALIKILSAKDTHNPVDLLITDIRMPVFSGYKLINELQKFNIYIPILIITSYDLKDHVKRLENIEYITKPFGYYKFLNAIDNIIQKNKN